jgi:hypothetical protein
MIQGYGSGSVHYLVLMDPDGPKTYGSYGSGSATLLFRVYYNKVLTGSVWIRNENLDPDPTLKPGRSSS